MHRLLFPANTVAAALAAAAAAASASAAVSMRVHERGCRTK